jgi:arylsulfatase A
MRLMTMQTGTRRELLQTLGRGLLAAGVTRAVWPLAQAQSRSRTNIILILADDLGYECLGCNGGQSYRTPNLDRMAAGGLRFEHCYAQPLCTPSRVQIMTGRYNFRNYKDFGYLDPDEVTFANILKQAGYATCIAGKWQLNGIGEWPDWQDTNRAGHFGFDEHCLWQYTRRGERYANPVIMRNGELLKGLEEEYGPDVFCDFVLDFIKRHRAAPFLVYYPMVLTHAPFVPTPDSPSWASGNRYKQNNRYFADMVAYMDKIVGRILDEIEALGLAEKTVILFTGDNGTNIKISSRWKDRDYPGGKGNMWDPGTHVPLIASWKKAIPPGTVCSDLVDFSDVLPTLAEAGRAKLPGRITLDGRSFLPQLRGEKGNPRNWVFCHYDQGKESSEERHNGRYAREKRYKLYMNGKMYDVPADLLEQYPIEGTTAEAREARRRLQKVLDSMPPYKEINTKGKPGDLWQK